MNGGHRTTPPTQRLDYRQRQKLAKIERTLRHAQGTRPTDHDSWLNAYQDDVAWLIQRLAERGLL